MSSLRAGRLHHAIAATIITVLLALSNLHEPLDWGAWTIQSRIGQKIPSGQIVFVEADASVADADVPEKRAEFAELLDTFKRSDANRVFVDVIFDRRSDRSADAALKDAAKAWGDRLTFVNRIDVAASATNRETRSIGAIAGGNKQVWMGSTSEFPNVDFTLPYAYRTSGGVRQSFPAALAGAPASGAAPFQVDYGFPSRAVASVSVQGFMQMSAADRKRLVAGKVVVVGTREGSTPADLRVPSQLPAPPSFVAIYGAETLLRGGIGFVSAIPATLFITALLMILSGAKAKRVRAAGYTALSIATLVLILVPNPFDMRIESASGAVMLVIYAGLRSRFNWRNRVAKIDPDTGLPTIRALASEIETLGDEFSHVAVAKIHGYETILKTLDAGQRAIYVTKLVERLRVGDARLQVFVDGQYLAWLVEQEDQSKLLGHLEGLRAIFAAPVTVDGQSIDVGITFGAARIAIEQGERSLAAALAAVEETSEALEPVKLAQDMSEGDSLWDLSLRARIDAAMEAGEVFCVYQPKIDISADRIIGVEALVRWEDPERGFIPPLHFVMQCEKAGRMEYLTRYVLQSACSAGRLLHFRGSRITMSVNISATLLSDMRIVGIVRNVLQASDFDPNYLVLEITETARIRNLTVARSVLKALKALGTHLSMDDFGVGAANFEALQALPFDELKIDRQFVGAATTSSKARAIMASLVGLGTSARIAVVAEGAETDTDLQMLRDIGCWQVQGYALAKPMPLTKLLIFVGADNEKVGGAIV